MDVKEAVRTSREYVAELFGDEDISEVRLEEVIIEDTTGEWCVTIGFNRRASGPADTLGERLALNLQRERTYKVVRLDRRGEVRSVTDRALPALNA